MRFNVGILSKIGISLCIASHSLLSILHLVACEPCNKNADCIAGQCVCKHNYTGGGMSCERIMGKWQLLL